MYMYDERHVPHQDKARQTLLGQSSNMHELQRKARLNCKSVYKSRGAGSSFALVRRKSSLAVKPRVVSVFDLFSAVRKLLDGWNFAGIVSALTAADSISTNHQQLLL